MGGPPFAPTISTSTQKSFPTHGIYLILTHPRAFALVILQENLQGQHGLFKKAFLFTPGRGS